MPANFTGSLAISGSLLITGSIQTTGGITISGSIASASYALSSSNASNAELLDNLDSTAFVFTSSYNVASSSLSTRVTKIEGNYATTGSNAFNGSQNITGSLTVSQAVIAQTLNVQQVTSSIVYSCGSNVFGCALTDVQQMTGSLRVSGSNALFNVGCVGIGVSSNLTGKINLPSSDYGEGINFFPDTNFYNRTGIGKYTSEFRFYIPKGDFYSWYSCGPTGTEIFRLTGNDGTACFSGSLSAASLRIGIDCSGVIVDVQCRHGLMKYYNYATGLVGACCNTDSGVSTWLGRFAGPITAPTAVYQDLVMTTCGIASFRCQVCAPTFVASGLNIDLGTTSSNTYKALNFINDCNTQGNVIGMARNDGQFLTSACGGDFIIGAATNKKILFGNTQTGTTEYMRITNAGDVGIGVTTTGTNVKLKVKASSDGSGISLSSATFVIARSATDTQLGIGYYTTPDAWVISSTYGSTGAYQPLVFATSDTERMRITTGGNIQIGTVSNSSGNRFEVYSDSVRITAQSNNNDTAGFFMRVMNGASQVGNATVRTNNAGLFSIFTGTSSETQALNITSTGCVGIGIATPGTKLHVYDGASIARMLVENSTNSSFALYQSKTANSSLWQWGTWNDNSYRVGISGVGDFITVESNGEVGIGTTAPQSLLHVCRGDISLEIGSEGNSCKLFFSVDHNAHYIRGTGYWVDIVGNENEILRVWKGDTSIAACEVIRVTGTGITCFKATVCAPCFATISDYRMKYDVKPITNSIGLISQMKPYSFKLNYDCQTSFGMIAHELQEVVPEAVFGVKDGETMQGVDYMKLLPIAIKSIQEQQCQICSQATIIHQLKTCLGMA